MTESPTTPCPRCHGTEIRRGEAITGVSYRTGAPLPRQPRPTRILYCGFCKARTSPPLTWEQAEAALLGKGNLLLPTPDPFGRGRPAIN
jgi:hypothetical protein